MGKCKSRNVWGKRRLLQSLLCVLCCLFIMTPEASTVNHFLYSWLRSASPRHSAGYQWQLLFAPPDLSVPERPSSPISTSTFSPADALLRESHSRVAAGLVIPHIQTPLRRIRSLFPCYSPGPPPLFFPPPLLWNSTPVQTASSEVSRELGSTNFRLYQWPGLTTPPLYPTD